jgi:tRNA threonylcarbamoyladenosine biosynthesis protein TsaE
VTAPLEIQSNTPQHTFAIAQAVARLARPGDVVGLIGELGAGKTQFVRGLAAGLGLDPQQVSSPTFVIVQEYEPDHPDQPVLVHIDAYRLAGPGDLESIGWDDQGQELRDQAVVAVEWADLIRDSLGPDWLEARLDHAGPGRRITLIPHGRWLAEADTLARDCTDLAAGLK